MTNDSSCQNNSSGETKNVTSKSCESHKCNSDKQTIYDSLWVKILVIIFLANFVVIIIFTTIMNRKLNEAIELAKPQEGTLTLIKSDECTLCRDFSSQKKSIMAQNVDILDDNEFSSQSDEGKSLIKLYEIKKLPAIIFEAKKRIKSSLKQSLEKNSRSVGDNVLVWEQENPPYFDQTTGETAGLVEAIYLTDKTCKKCYDAPQLHKGILSRFGITLSSEKTIDISDAEGKKLLSEYNITSVPTLILSPQISAYKNLQSTWTQVGSIEEDKTYVFRNLDALNVTYKDLESRKIVEAKKK